MLGTSDAWSMIRSSHRPSDSAYYIEGCRISELLAQNSYFRNSGEWVPNPLFYAPLFPLDIFKGWSTFLEHCVSWQVFEMFPWPFSVPMALARVSELKWWQKWSNECLFFDNIGIAKIQNWLGWKGLSKRCIIKTIVTFERYHYQTISISIFVNLKKLKPWQNKKGRTFVEMHCFSDHYFFFRF